VCCLGWQLFAENRKISCSAGSAEELTQTLKQMLNLTQPIGVVIYDKYFDEYRCETALFLWQGSSWR
jgi:hypothetical protein